MDWNYPLCLDEAEPQAAYLRVAEALVADIQAGRLAAGAPLPGTRRLARSLQLHRNTVVAAYRELLAEGWIDTRPGQGTFVGHRSVGPAASLATRSSVPSQVHFPLRRASGAFTRGQAPPPGVLNLGHLPDPASAPAVALARAYRRALRRNQGALDYENRHDAGAPFGDERLRAALAAMLTRRRGLVCTGANVMVSSGSQMALYLAAQVLVEPGDVIAVEALGYRPAWETFRLAGANLVPVALDSEGLCVDALAALADAGRLRAVYVTPHHQHPTGVTLSKPRRQALLEFATARRVAVIEDDYDSDFHHHGPPQPPLASRDFRGVVVYVGSLSKVLAPGIRIGYTVAPAPMLEAMAARRCFIDRQGDHVLAGAVAELLEDGDVQRHITRMGAALRAQRDVLAEALGANFGAELHFEMPAGGTALWAAVAPDVDVDAWHRHALARGVTFCCGRLFTCDDRPIANVRLGYASLGETDLVEAVRRLHAAFEAAARETRRRVSSAVRRVCTSDPTAVATGSSRARHAACAGR